MKIQRLIILIVLSALCMAACRSLPAKEVVIAESSSLEPVKETVSASSSQPSEEEAKQIINQVVPPANELARKILTGNFDLDYDTKDGDYYLIQGYNSYQAFKDEISHYFSSKIADEIFTRYFSGDMPLFKDVDGRLYGIEANAGCYVNWETDTAKNITVSPDEIQAEMICFRDMEDLNYYPLELIKQDDRWVVSSEINPTSTSE